MSNKRTSRWSGPSRRPGIQKRISSHFAKYSGSLPKELASNQDALTAKVVCEGSIHVALGLFDEAVEDGNGELADAILDSLKAAREHLNSLRLDAVNTQTASSINRIESSLEGENNDDKQ